LLLFQNHFAALVRRGHPAVIDGRLTIQALGTHPHLVLSSTGEETAFVDHELARHGLVRRVELEGPLLAAASALERSDMIAIMGERGARAFARTTPLEVLELPFASPMLVTAMLWHRRVDKAPAHRWLRSVVMQVARTL